VEDPVVTGKIIIRWILRKYFGGHGLDSSGSGKGQMVGNYKCDAEILVSIKFGEFLD
jgi:hypothetical protein